MIFRIIYLVFALHQYIQGKDGSVQKVNMNRKLILTQIYHKRITLYFLFVIITKSLTFYPTCWVSSEFDYEFVAFLLSKRCKRLLRYKFIRGGSLARLDS